MAAHDDLTRTMRINVSPEPEEGAGVAPGWKMSVHDIASFREKRKDFRSRRAEYEKLLECIYDGVLITSPSGAILEVNERSCEFFGYTHEEIVKLNMVDLISGADAGLVESIRANLEHHCYTLIEGQCVRKDQSLFPSEIAVNKLNLHDDDHLCFFVRNITQRKRAQEQLEEAVKRLEAHDRSRLQFVTNVSHELKTPLTSMLYAVHNLLSGLGGTLPDKVREYLEVMDGDCKRMLSTVNDILDLRRIEMDRLTLSLQKVPVARMLDRTLASLRVQARQKSLSLTLKNRDRNLFMLCDPARLERVIINVVGNALKFTATGGRIEVSTALEEGKQRMAVLHVKDNGVGIPKELISRVTERYFTVGEQPSGSGLGLAISKEIVDLHGGRMEIQSPPPGADRGTLVSVRIPVTDPPKIVAVEDNEAVLAVIGAQLEQDGYRPILVTEGQVAYEVIRREKPEVIVLDLVLPDVQGPELIVRLKSSNETARIPIIVVTGAHLGGASAEILRNFAIPILTKPWEETDLLDLVAESFFSTALVSRAPPRRTRHARGGTITT